MSNWLLGCFILSVIVFSLGIITAVMQARQLLKKRIFFSSFHAFFIGSFLALLVLFIPIFRQVYRAEAAGGIVAAIVSLYTTLQVFSINADFDIVRSALRVESGWVVVFYYIFASVLYVLAPILTFGFILSLFQNLASYLKYLLHPRKDAYIFSELNERSIALAQSEKVKHGRKIIIVFTDVYISNNEPSAELIDQARRFGAILFKKDILAVKFRRHCPKAELNFFVVGSDEDENIGHALQLYDGYSTRPQTGLYVFSSTRSSELLLSGKNDKIKLRRINEIRSLIYRTLYEYGMSVFESAMETDGNKMINAVIVGLGQHGSEMLKALAWFAQMDGYKLNIHAFEKDANQTERLKMTCPELLDSKHNGQSVPGEAAYNIVFHTGIDVTCAAFAQTLGTLGKVTYVFVALGNDEMNTEVAVRLRAEFKKMKCKPVIHAVVYSTEKRKSLEGIKTPKGEPYNITFVGDLETMYSDAVIINSDLESQALSRHLKWGDENSFWEYEYNYRSSIASVIHKKMRRACNIPGSSVAADDRTEQEKAVCRSLEHRRWNAYMRSEGWTYSGSIKMETRDDMAKVHNLLVPFDFLPENEKIKDDD